MFIPVLSHAVGRALGEQQERDEEKDKENAPARLPLHVASPSVARLFEPQKKKKKHAENKGGKIRLPGEKPMNAKINFL